MSVDIPAQRHMAAGCGISQPKYAQSSATICAVAAASGRRTYTGAKGAVVRWWSIMARLRAAAKTRAASPMRASSETSTARARS